MIADIRTNPLNASPLYKIANPKSIAVFGASAEILKMGSVQMDSIRSMGFEGMLYPVHPKEKELLGYKAYPSVMDLPEVPDLALIVLPTAIVAKTLEACGRKGIRHAVVVSGGFKEVGSKGAELEEELIAVARRYGIRFLGPNCLGVTNPHMKLNSTFLLHEGEPGFIGLASQSGSIVTQTFNYMAQMNLGYSTAFSVGNEASIDIVDYLEYLGQCPHTKVIALYIEGIRRGREFVKAARRIVPQKPIVALYIGGSEIGGRAGMSHTGALSGPDPLYNGIFRQAGVIRAHSLTEMFDICWALGTLPPINGRKVVIQTNSGGPGGMAADACDRAGLTLPQLSDETISKLKTLLPPTASLNNPIDMTFARNHEDYAIAIPEAILKDRNCDALMIYFVSYAALFERVYQRRGVPAQKAEQDAIAMTTPYAEKMAQMISQGGKPVIVFSLRNYSEPFIAHLTKKGVPVYQDPVRAVRAIQALVEYKELCRKIADSASLDSDDELSD